MHTKITPPLIKLFEAIVGSSHCFSDYEIRWTYAFGGSLLEKSWIPDLILVPENAQQVSAILKLANKNGIPIIPRGSGTSLSAGHLSALGGIILDLNQMNKILNIDIQNNLVEVEPGVICDVLNKKLEPFGYFFPPDPGSSSVCTIGGMCATNAGGIQAFKYGVTKDYVLYLEVALANGDILKFGTEVLKSVSSYNLKDLFIGSEGTLGVIPKIGLRIKPTPLFRKLGLYIFKSIHHLSEAVIELRKRGIVPIMLEFLDKISADVIFNYLKGEFLDYPEGYVLIADIDGTTLNEVNEKYNCLHEVMINQKLEFFKIAETEKEREMLINARKSALPALARAAPSCCLEDCTIKISDFSEVIKKIENLPKDLQLSYLRVATFGHMDGNLHPTFLFNENHDLEVQEFEKAIDFLYNDIILPFKGTITGEHGIGKIKTPFLIKEHGREVVKIMHKIKKLFDPNLILNPGIGKGDDKKPRVNESPRILINFPNHLLELNCIRCGFCTIECPSKIHYFNEAYSPRGRLSILNGLVHGEIKLENQELINEIFHSCTLCGLCLSQCPAGVPTQEIFENARKILHEAKKHGNKP
ncbi:MAG: FAD-binding oxidoreductase [Promethearchaeota archaeon]|nr:MAG: FAD-binding oxidoreductase [Candidatus Lokiarchaeota archaeon]